MEKIYFYCKGNFLLQPPADPDMIGSVLYHTTFSNTDKYEELISTMTPSSEYDYSYISSWEYSYEKNSIFLVQKENIVKTSELGNVYLQYYDLSNGKLVNLKTYKADKEISLLGVKDNVIFIKVNPGIVHKIDANTGELIEEIDTVNYENFSTTIDIDTQDIISRAIIPIGIAWIQENTSGWEVYRNEKIGIEFKYPDKAKAYHTYWNGNYDKCEGDRDVLLPWKVFSDDKDIALRVSYYYKVDEGNNCQRIYTNFEKFMGESYMPNWYIVSVEINNEEELNNYINKNFSGDACSLGGLYETNQTGVFDVKIQGDGKDKGSTKCWAVFSTNNLKYYPEKNKLFRWNTGGECIISSGYPTCFDDEIKDSMVFF